jgi:DNA-binding beta-propeller fold protein YncE
MKPAARDSDLLYISDIGTDDVYAFSYPRGKLVGTLTGFQEPVGLCVGKGGKIWVADAKAGEIFEYAHAGTAPIATLNDNGEEPFGCAIDPASGNLAVSNAGTASGGNGSVSVYRDASGTPTNYTDSAMSKMAFVGYDDGGNLFVDGADASSSFAFAELASGGSALTNIYLPQSFEAAGGVAWDGKYIAVGDLLLGYVYQFSIDASGDATEVGSTDLADGAWVEEFCFPLDRHHKAAQQGKRIIGPAVAEQHVGFWDYPSGDAIKLITQVDEPVGSAVSRGKT